LHIFRHCCLFYMYTCYILALHVCKYDATDRLALTCIHAYILAYIHTVVARSQGSDRQSKVDASTWQSAYSYNVARAEVCMYVCMYICMYVYAYPGSCLKTYICTHLRTCIHTCLHTYIHRSQAQRKQIFLRLLSRFIDQSSELPEDMPMCTHTYIQT
jgi:hypothetical protein